MAKASISNPEVKTFIRVGVFRDDKNAFEATNRKLLDKVLVMRL